jgi:hypothetical protein
MFLKIDHQSFLKVAFRRRCRCVPTSKTDPILGAFHAYCSQRTSKSFCYLHSAQASINKARWHEKRCTCIPLALVRTIIALVYWNLTLGLKVKARRYVRRAPHTEGPVAVA